MYRGKLCFTMALALCLTSAVCADDKDEKKDKTMLAHIVYFTLKDSSAESKKQFVALCDKYLSGHPGTAFYASGPRAEELDREVNDKEYDVGLHLIFESKEAQDKYQVSERHQQFIKEGKDKWKGVRVFDTYLQKKEEK